MALKVHNLERGEVGFGLCLSPWGRTLQPPWMGKERGLRVTKSARIQGEDMKQKGNVET